MNNCTKSNADDTGYPDNFKGSAWAVEYVMQCNFSFHNDIVFDGFWLIFEKKDQLKNPL